MMLKEISLALAPHVKVKVVCGDDIKFNGLAGNVNRLVSSMNRTITGITTDNDTVILFIK